jgi:hypothetical protein
MQVHFTTRDLKSLKEKWSMVSACETVESQEKEFLLPESLIVEEDQTITPEEAERS